MKKPDRNQFIGRTFDGFQVQSFLGSGAFAYVYYAVSPTRGPVAVKIQYNLADDAKKRFAREIKVLKQLPPSPHITRYIDDGVTQEGLPYLTMEFIDGTTLKDSMRFKPQWESVEACQFMLELCDAFNGLHQLGLAHRDVKPENIMLTRDWKVKLMDLGLVKDAQGLLQLFEQEDILHGTDFAENLDKGVLAGTPEYMAPEQFSDPSLEDAAMEQTDTTTDVYSLGLIFYQLLTGEKLFPFKPRSKNQTEYARALLEYLEMRTNQRDDDIDRPPQCPAPLWTVVQRSLRLDPKLRQRNANELGQDVKRYLDTGQGVIVQDEDRTSAIDLNTFMAMHGDLPGSDDKTQPTKPPPGASEPPQYKTQPLPASWMDKPPPGASAGPPQPGGGGQAYNAHQANTAALPPVRSAPPQQQQQPQQHGGHQSNPGMYGYPNPGGQNTPYPGQSYGGYDSNPGMQSYPGAGGQGGYTSNPNMYGYPPPPQQQPSGGVSITMWLIVAVVVLAGLGAVMFFMLL